MYSHHQIWLLVISVIIEYSVKQNLDIISKNRDSTGKYKYIINRINLQEYLTNKNLFDEDIS